MKSLQAVKKRDNEKKATNNNNTQVNGQGNRQGNGQGNRQPKHASKKIDSCSKITKQTARGTKSANVGLKRTSSQRSLTKSCKGKYVDTISIISENNVQQSANQPTQHNKVTISRGRTLSQRDGKAFPEKDVTLQNELRMIRSKFPKPRRTGTTHVDEEPLVNDKYYSEMYDEVDTVGGLPGMVTHQMIKPSVSRHASIIINSPSVKGESELDMCTYNTNTVSCSSLSNRPQSVLSTATVDLDEKIASSHYRSKSRTGLFSGSSSKIKIKRINSEPDMDASPFGSANLTTKE